MEDNYVYIVYNSYTGRLLCAFLSEKAAEHYIKTVYVGLSTQYLVRAVKLRDVEVPV